MVDDELIEFAKSLDTETAGSTTHIEQLKPPHLMIVTANRAGFLRLAAEFLRAGCAPTDDEGNSETTLIKTLHHRDFLNDDLDCVIAGLQRREVWPDRDAYLEAQARVTERKDRPALLACGIAASVVIGLLAMLVLFVADAIRDLLQ